MKPTEKAGLMAIVIGFRDNYRVAGMEAHGEGDHETGMRLCRMADLIDRMTDEIRTYLDDCEVTDESPERTV